MLLRYLSIISLLILICLEGVSPAYGQDTIRYDVSFPNAVHHEAKISATWSNVPGGTFSIRMSRSSPGRYALTEFAKNVYDVTANDSHENALTISRPDPYGWEINDHGNTIVLSYTLYGERADGTYAGIDETHAHLNIPSAFVYAKGLEQRPISITFHPPANSKWQVATQLKPTGDPLTFTSPNLKYFMDCPTELGPTVWREWNVRSGTKNPLFRLALHHAGTDSEATAFAAMAKAVVMEEEGIYGEFPDFDYGTYTFIADYLPYVFGDGMEHRNSTSITGMRPIRTNAVDNIGTVSHEFFHSWNVKRIRPKSLEPFDFERVNMSGELWFAEGFTNYYGKLALYRAHLVNLDRFTKSIGSTISFVTNAPGRNYYSPVEMSEQAAFTDGASFIDDQNKANTFITYYVCGEEIALGLDLTLRTQFKNLTLDSLMRAAWKKFGKPEHPYTNDDIRNLLGSITNDRSFADDFFRKYIFGNEIPDFQKLLMYAGFHLHKAKKGKAWLGQVSLRPDNGSVIINSPTIIGSPLYLAGLDHRDHIIAIDTMKITSQKDFDSALSRHKPGDSVVVTADRRGLEQTFIILCAESPELEIVPYEDAHIELTGAMKDFRDAWLGSKSLTPLPELWKYCPKCGQRYAFPFEKCPDDDETLRITREELSK